MILSLLFQLKVYTSHDTLDAIHVMPSEVFDVLKTLKTGKASDPDGINYRVLVEAAVQLAPHFCDLFKQSLNTSLVPSSWKISNVCPVFKSGDPSILSIYRPVSLLSSIDKVFERIIFKHVYNYLKDTDFFTRHQSGFMPGDSTINQITYLYNSICKALNDGLEFRVVFFDISKAFDKVWHKGLVLKLRRAGIRGKLLAWFQVIFPIVLRELMYQEVSLTYVTLKPECLRYLYSGLFCF